MLVERLPVAHAAAHEFRPFGDERNRIRFFRQQSPKGRVVPAKFVTAAVAMFTDSLPKFLDFFNELFA